MAVWTTQMRKGMLELALLNLLLHKESYGYAIVQSLQSFRELDVHESTVYPILRRLRSEGLLSVRLAESSGGPPRRYFSLSAKGKERLVDMNECWESVCCSIERLQKGKGIES